MKTRTFTPGRITPPMRRVLTAMQRGATLWVWTERQDLNPWLEIPGQTKVVHVSGRTVQGLWDRQFIHPIRIDKPDRMQWALTSDGRNA